MINFIMHLARFAASLLSGGKMARWEAAKVEYSRRSERANSLRWILRRLELTGARGGIKTLAELADIGRFWNLGSDLPSGGFVPAAGVEAIREEVP